ncbi:hypothetical protein B0H34DRAFT_794509 [Crassisporium funariophilum]|nr:hypothetical protein B0H34DRAFT_794509 [Crassisporium funariophilum]
MFAKTTSMLLITLFFLLSFLTLSTTAAPIPAPNSSPSMLMGRVYTQSQAARAEVRAAGNSLFLRDTDAEDVLPVKRTERFQRRLALSARNGWQGVLVTRAFDEDDNNEKEEKLRPLA